LFREALAASDLALAGVSRIADFDHQFLGYSIEHWIMSLRGRILVRLGNFEEGRRCFDRILAIEPGLIDPTVRFICNLGYVDLAWCLDDAAMANEHAGRVADLAGRQGSPYLRTYSLACNGTAQMIAGDCQAAIQSFGEGIKFLREARVAMEIEPEMLASLADAQLRSGAFAAAISTAEEAAAMSSDRSARLAQCRADIVLASSLTAQGNADVRDRAAKLLDSAEQLISTSGASIYARLLSEARAAQGVVTARC
jgi:adenylate cyclase